MVAEFVSGFVGPPICPGSKRYGEARNAGEPAVGPRRTDGRLAVPTLGAAGPSICPQPRKKGTGSRPEELALIACGRRFGRVPVPFFRVPADRARRRVGGCRI